MRFWLHSCPKCEGDLATKQDLDGTFIQCMQCGGELTPAEQRGLLELGYVPEATEPAEAQSA